MSAIVLRANEIGGETYTFTYDRGANVSRMFNEAGVELCMGCGQPMDLCECEREVAAEPDPED